MNTRCCGLVAILFSVCCGCNHSTPPLTQEQKRGLEIIATIGESNPLHDRYIETVKRLDAIRDTITDRQTKLDFDVAANKISLEYYRLKREQSEQAAVEWIESEVAKPATDLISTWGPPNSR